MEDDVREWFIEMFWACKHCQTRNPGMSGAERESLRCVTRVSGVRCDVDGTSGAKARR